jgi:hypothetical protein
MALGILGGDEQGRVNLLYVLLLFAFLPVVALLFSVVFALSKSGAGLTNLLLALPLWPDRFHRHWTRLGDSRTRKLWMFYQSQFLTLGFGAGGLFALFIVLLGSDVSFVWRSTLLDATDLFPVLHVLSLPWLFWPEAQPQMELLQASQDFRLSTPQFTASMLGQWWKYVFAAQCFYNIMPRVLMLFAARLLFNRAVAKLSGAEEITTEPRKIINTVPEKGNLAPLVTQLPDNATLINWAQIPVVLRDKLQTSSIEFSAVLEAGPLSILDAKHMSKVRGKRCVIVVRAWEPPLGELGDYLLAIEPAADNCGLVLPLDWNNDQLRLPDKNKLQEWRRFCGGFENWSVLQLPGEVAL